MPIFHSSICESILPHSIMRSTNAWYKLCSMLVSCCPHSSVHVVFSERLCVCVKHWMCPCAVWGPHCGFLFLPTNLSLSSLPLFLCSFTPPAPQPLSKLPSTLLSLPLSRTACQEEVNNMTFGCSDNILPYEFPVTPAFLSHSHQFVFAPGASVFLRNDHLGTRWLTSSSRGAGRKSGLRGVTHTDIYMLCTSTPQLRVSHLWFHLPDVN